jgi:peptidoglycan/xylan/chitin deacetylase (PgdA/CDA1 family)
MYFGSVRFFKHLIAAVLLLLVVSLTISTISLAAINKTYRSQISDMQTNTVLAQSNPKEEKQQNSLSLDYQKMYPDLHVKPAKAQIAESKTVYLTFDDGPSARTGEILDILKNENIKATFFIIGREGENEKELMKRIVNEGHTLGIHTYSHVYTDIYKSVDSYLTDFNKTYDLIYDTTGVKPEIFRFPGGSINKYSSLIYEEIIAEMLRRGFTYYDWNASSGDATVKASTDSVYYNAIQSSGNKDRVVLLMHDSIAKTYTVAALPKIIEFYKSKGYQFASITNEVRPITFNYVDN